MSFSIYEEKTEERYPNPIPSVPWSISMPDPTHFGGRNSITVEHLSDKTSGVAAGPSLVIGSPSTFPSSRIANLPHTSTNIVQEMYSAQAQPLESQAQPFQPLERPPQPLRQSLEAQAQPLQPPARPSQSIIQALQPLAQSTASENDQEEKADSSPMPSHSLSPRPANDNEYKYDPIRRNSEYQGSKMVDMWRQPLFWRLLGRALCFFSSVGALGFILGAGPRSNQPIPFDTPALVYVSYIVGSVSILTSLAQVLDIALRLLKHRRLIPRSAQLLADSLFSLLWSIVAFVQIARFPCSPGGNAGWCDFYNTSLFFSVVSMTIFLVMTIWDIIGTVFLGKPSKNSEKQNEEV
ncbi:uncharacterized protein VTP21DRAFT_7152 [Calcarisporiella thermophila]|uniref:uncharacterized protein n=1 Tax=Calcarisporiella thermophila TaxID=911321 RepID=UPI003742EC9C